VKILQTSVHDTAPIQLKNQNKILHVSQMLNI